MSVVTGTVLRGGDVSLRVDVRAVAVTTVLLLGVAGVGAYTLSTGEFELPLSEVLAALAGQGDGWSDFVVNTVRLPRLVVAVLVGAALAVSGAIMQSLTRNSLGSPDFIGITHGASTGAVLAIVVLHGSMAEIALGGLIGGLATAVGVYLLAFRRGVSGYRFVLVGIGMSAMMLAVNNYLITRATWQDALAAQAWLVGTLNDRRWDEATMVGLALAVLLSLALYLGRRQSMLELGDDAARALGVGVESTRLLLILASVALAAIATAACGPITFVALAAPQLARRLTRSTGSGLLPAAAMGALLLAVSDLVVQRGFQPVPLPVGVATGVLGGGYLLWLLASEWRKGARL
jgi:iron complex transport system permease protein